MDNVCPHCGSENIYFSHKKQKWICEDCEKSYIIEKTFVSQKVFLSYGHDKNAALVNRIEKDLETKGHLPWIDCFNIKSGEDWRNSITKGIKDSHDFLAFISCNSIRVPGVCLDEISIALGTRNCHIQTILLERGTSVPSSINSIQWLDMSDWEYYYEQGGNVWENWYQNKYKQLISIIEDEKNTTISGEITKLDSILTASSPEIKLKLLMKEEYFGRKWLINQVNEWYREKKNSRIFWICGLPGTGKSAFSAFLSNFFFNCVVVYFCEWDKKESQNSSQIIKSIAFQLACSLQDYRTYLMDVIEKRNLDLMSDADLFDYLLIYPLNSLIDGGREQKVIIIDALDEANDFSCNSFVKLFAYKLEEFPSWLRFIVTSRPDTTVLNSLYRYEPHLLSLDSKENQDDISNFITHHIDDSDLAARIFRKCGGCFLYAKEIIREIENNEVKPEEIDSLSHGIAGMYYHYFVRIFPENNEYRLNFRPYLRILIGAKTPLEIDVVCSILKWSKEEFLDYASRLSSFFLIITVKGKKVIKPYHKMIVDWIKSPAAGEFEVDEAAGSELLALHAMKLLCTEEGKIPQYFVRHSLAHIIESGIWAKLLQQDKTQILVRLIELSVRNGYRDCELAYINNLECVIALSEKSLYISLKLSYYSRTQGSMLVSCANDLLNSLQNESDPIKKYHYTEDVAVAYFYAGLNKDGMRLLEEERKCHDDAFWKDNSIRATYNHTIGLFAHNLDLNKKVIEAASQASEDYKTLNKLYCQMVSRVNLFDGLMGVGDLDEATIIARQLFIDNQDNYFIHIDDILNICYANLLYTQGKIMEALDYYEKGLLLAGNIQDWDYLYGSIWRELAIAEFGDRSCLEKLLHWKEVSELAHYDFLVSLAGCFYLLAIYKLGDDIETYANEIIFDQLIMIGIPGHCALIQMVYLLKGFDANNVEQKLLDTVSLILQCQGIKGAPEIIYEFWTKYESSLQKTYNVNELQEWMIQYIKPIIDFRINWKSALISDLPAQPYLNKCSCVGCEGKCCYDGVYVSSKEEQVISGFVQKYPEYFTDLSNEYIVDGNWPGLEAERKTAVKKHMYTVADYPEHFKQTRCVFAYDSGECALQRVATDRQMHPWKIKPKACWAFPIHDLIKGRIIPPPLIGEKDPDYIDCIYPGYSTFLPCAKAQVEGYEWKKLLIKEIEYYRFTEKSKEYHREQVKLNDQDL